MFDRRAEEKKGEYLLHASFPEASLIALIELQAEA